MRIGIYSGMFDPLTNGHLWVINQGKTLFDEFRVVVGPNPSKKAMFHTNQRVDMLRESTDGVLCDSFTSGTVVDYIDRVAEDMGLSRKDFSIVRGIRNNDDLAYEANIWRNIRYWANDLQFQFLSPPKELAHISSSWVKDLCKNKRWDLVEDSVPPSAVKRLRMKTWIVLKPEVASIFETTTAGFGPSPDETLSFTSAYGHKFEMIEEFVMEDVPYVPNDAMEKARSFANKLIGLGMINFSKTITGDQVRKTLDPFPVDVVCSDTFTLKEISVFDVEPLGHRFLSSSRSIAPIIVDRNEAIPVSEFSDVYKDVGPYIVIEGKHRLLDAKARGEEKILAWVGDKIGDALDE